MTVLPAASPAPMPRLVPRLVALVVFIQLLDGTIIVTSLPAMAAAFGVDAVTMSIGITAYLLALAAVVPAAGWVGERFGARRVLVGSLGLFTLASLLCALAPSLGAFVAARVLQGAAAALMAPVGRLLVLRNARKSDLMGAISTITWPALFAPVIGPVLGAWITETAGWEWNFLINLPLGLGAMALFLLLVPEGDRDRAVRFDGRGFALCSLALLGTLGGLELVVGGTGSLWAGILLLAGIAFGGLGLRHMGRAEMPLFDLRVLSVPSFRLATMTAGTLGRMTINATPFLLPLLFQVGFGLSAIASGRLVLVYFLGNLVMKSVTSPVLRRWGFRSVVVGNGLLAAATVGSFALVPAGLPEMALWVLLFAAGASRSMQLTALNTLAFADIGERQRATSATLTAMTQQLAQLLGVALSVVAIRASQSLRDAPASGLPDLRAAFVGMAALGVLSALAFLRLAPGTGREVSGHRA